ncbi:MAG: hypothetical protein ACLRWQ_06945 [Flavonifractor plautii]
MSRCPASPPPVPPSSLDSRGPAQWHPLLAGIHPLDGRHGRAGAAHRSAPLPGHPFSLPHPSARTPGPVFSKLVPKQSQTSKILYGIYCATDTGRGRPC